MSKNTYETYDKGFSYYLKTYIIPIAVAIVLFFCIDTWVVKMVRVDGNSMQPNLQNNQRIVVLPEDHVKPLSVIVFNAHGEDPSAKQNKTYYVKRVIGMPGDTVSHYGNNIYVNGKRLNQNFISNYQKSGGTSITGFQTKGNWNVKKLAPHWTHERGSIKVPQGQYFVLGDHRSISNDSRYWGFVPANKIMGVVKSFPWSNDHYQINDEAY